MILLIVVLCLLASASVVCVCTQMYLTGPECDLKHNGVPVSPPFTLPTTKPCWAFRINVMFQEGITDQLLWHHYHLTYGHFK